MPTVEELLIKVDTLLDRWERRRAFTELKDLIEESGDDNFLTFAAEIEARIRLFYPKDKKRLTALYERRIRRAGETSADEATQAVLRPQRVNTTLFRARTRKDLELLSAHHIFQWSTYYQDFIQRAANECLNQTNDARLFSFADTLSEELEAHSIEIFERGFEYCVTSKRTGSAGARQKSIAGLRSFLDLPVEHYAADLGQELDARTCRHRRYVTSAILRAILVGFTQAKLGDISSLVLLREDPLAWVHCAPFLTAEHLRELLLEIGTRVAGDTDMAPAIVLAESLDRLGIVLPEYPISVLRSVFNVTQGWLDVALCQPTDAEDERPIEIGCALSVKAPLRTLLANAKRSKYAAALVVSSEDEELGPKKLLLTEDEVVAVEARTMRSDAAVRKVVELLEFTISERRGERISGKPLRFNVARDFPLHNPRQLKYFRVNRPTVRALLQTMARRNGIRLWCSVRRSGKTTASFELSGGSDLGVVITQTCDSTHPVLDASALYDDLVSCIQARQFLSKSFVKDTVDRCSPPAPSRSGRTVLIIDEYERLFGMLKVCHLNNTGVQHLVIQPLLDQFVAFARDNLLVFLGQQPNAHFILMDHNQLSAYVEQDGFPLFSLGERDETSEFAELVRKVLTDKIRFDLSFLSELFGETAGHPFITVNVLIELVEFLIEKMVPVRETRLSAQHFEEFRQSRLTPKSVARSGEYDFFRHAAAEVLGKAGKVHAPWLHAVYTVLRAIAADSQESFKMSHSDYSYCVSRLALQRDVLSPENLLTTAKQANFLEYDADWVWPKIRMLARICRDAQAVD